jgi:gamma-glutamyltranspeptidase/glutathione hydrolase
LCCVDREGRSVSLIQSNASGFGSWLVEPNTGINLHNRGLGFDLGEDHPNGLRPGARPAHTLSPALVTDRSGRLRAVLGSMGGDAQPQIVAQLVARLLAHGDAPAAAVAAPRWILSGPGGGFDTWGGAPYRVLLEGHAPADWDAALSRRGHRVERAAPFDTGVFGHAHIIAVDADGMLTGAADPRSRVGSCAGM